MLYETFENVINTVTRANYYDYIGKLKQIWKYMYMCGSNR